MRIDIQVNINIHIIIRNGTTTTNNNNNNQPGQAPGRTKKQAESVGRLSYVFVLWVSC